jgi:hypothetical protein
VGAIFALGLSVLSPDLSVLTLSGFLSVFGIGFMANEFIKGKKKPAEETPQ